MMRKARKHHIRRKLKSKTKLSDENNEVFWYNGFVSRVAQ